MPTRTRDKEFRNKQNKALQAKRLENIEKKTRESQRWAFNGRKESTNCPQQLFRSSHKLLLSVGEKR